MPERDYRTHLYHGTTASVARRALEEGLLPRSLSGSKGNWESGASNPNLVGLTTGYAPFYGVRALSGDDTEFGIVEIDTAALDPLRLLPDDDYLCEGYWAIRKDGGDEPTIFDDCPVGLDDDGVRLWLRDHIMEWPDLAQSSIEYLGTCAYAGAVPADAITRVAVADTSRCPLATQHALAPSICTANHLVVGSENVALTRWFMGEPVAAEDMSWRARPGWDTGDEVTRFVGRFREEQKHIEVLTARATA